MPEGEPKFGEKEQEKISNRETSISKTVDMSPEDESRLLETNRRIFNEQKIKESEREKTDEEKRIIENILREMDGFVRRYGGTPVALNPENIHILTAPEALGIKLENEKIAAGVYSSREQAILIFDVGDRLYNARHIAHEILHFNSFQSVSVDENGRPSARRIGFEIKTYNKQFYFKDVNEAVTEDLTEMFVRQCFDTIPELLEEKRRRLFSNLPENEYLSNEQERVDLHTFIYDIFIRNNDKFDSEEEVFDLFARAVLSGRLLPLARIIEKTYGKGSFRQIGEKTKEKS